MPLEPEYIEPMKAWKESPSPASNGAMLKALHPVISSAVKSYGGDNPGPLLMSQARRLALESLPRYDETKGSLRTHLDRQMQGLRRIRAKQDQIINIPEQVQLDQHHLFSAENSLKDELGRDPTTDELADHVGLSRKRIAYVRQARSGLAEGATERVTDDGDEMSSPAVVSYDESPWHEFVYGSLQPRDQLVMEWSLGMHGHKKTSALAIARKLGITPAAVSQRKAKIQAMMNKRQSLGIL